MPPLSELKMLNYAVKNYDNGAKYEGQLKDDKAHGKGILYSADGEKLYDGEWKDDKMHGKGILYSAKGEKYDGEWKDGKRVK